MNSPAAALTWEIWCRHRKRLLTLLGVMAGFALLYPALCRLVGLDLDLPDALDGVVTKASAMQGTRLHSAMIFQMLAWFFCLCAPPACMIISLFYVAWIFTFTDLNPREPFSFPKRLFTLPISTVFLASRLMASGTVAVFLVYLGWTQLVHQPHINVFDGPNDGLAWITFLILAQAIVWSLDAFPFTRMLLLLAAAFAVLVHPDFEWYHQVRSHQLSVQLALILTGCVMGFVGLSKIRHGGWQRWIWEWRLPANSARTELSGPKAFRSPVQAQFWYEWRRHGRKVFFTVCGFTGVPVLVMISEQLLYPGAISGDTISGLYAYLLIVPPFIHFCQGVAYERTMPQFTANRPLSNGEIIVAQWKAMALSAVLSWVVVFFLLGTVLLVANVSLINTTFASQPEYLHFIRPLLPVIVLGMVVVTWAVTADRVWMGAMMGTWIYRIYGAVIFAMFGLGLCWLYAVTHENTGFRETFFRMLPGLLACLVGLKLFLAQWAFRAASRQRLIAWPTVIRYLSLWTLLAVVLVLPVGIVCQQEKGLAIPLCLGILLLLPLARIGFAPVGLDRGRHQ